VKIYKFIAVERFVEVKISEFVNITKYRVNKVVVFSNKDKMRNSHYLWQFYIIIDWLLKKSWKFPFNLSQLSVS